MAKLVSIIGVPHDPSLPNATQNRGGALPIGVKQAFAQLSLAREMLAGSRPDALVFVGSDHLNQFFMHHMSPFVVGKAERLDGPFAVETRTWGLAPYSAPIDGTLARQILKGGYRHGVDFAYSDEFLVDHAFTIPLHFVRPEQDLPIVPIFVNLMAPPLPPGRRYFEVGTVVRRVIDEAPENKRIAVVATGHMVNAVGSAYMERMVSEPETEWDRTTMALIETNDVETLLARSTWDQMYQWGNGTPGFLGYVFAMGIARGIKPQHVHLVASSAQPACLFIHWDEMALNS